MLNISQRVRLMERIFLSINARSIRFGAMSFTLLAIAMEVFLVVLEGENRAVLGLHLMRVAEPAVFSESFRAKFGFAWTVSYRAVRTQSFGHVLAGVGAGDVFRCTVGVVVVAIGRAYVAVSKYS